MIKIYKKIMKDSLYKNSLYLMVSTLIMAMLGFLFWMINARLFSAEQIGLATTIISVMGLITGFSVLGLNIALIKYLPKSRRKSNKINTCFTIVILSSIVVSSIFLLGLGKFSPRLLFIKENLLLSFSFIFFMVVAGLNSIIESVFTAFRSAKFILVKNSIFSLLKIGLVFLFIGLGAYGIFVSWMLALMIGFGVVFIVLMFKFNYKPKFVFHDSIIKKMGRYSFGNYVAGFIGGLPLMVLPLMITNLLNPEITAYYYMAMMIAGLLFVIPRATTQSLFAEGSHNEKEMKKHVRKAIKIISLILIPGILIAMFFGDWILLMFGKEYSTEGFKFLQIVVLSGVFIGINGVFGALFRIKKKIKEMIFAGIVGAVLILGLSYLWIDKGLIGIAFAWIIGKMGISLVFWCFDN